mmetsp:Transcript_122614/g.291574  ORF Transcript_122614/g.291574 Transcript_122614/m.291574 type:complete len:258 (-) Transcript_122614:7-780(-)
MNLEHAQVLRRGRARIATGQGVHLNRLVADVPPKVDDGPTACSASFDDGLAQGRLRLLDRIILLRGLPELVEAQGAAGQSVVVVNHTCRLLAFCSTLDLLLGALETHRPQVVVEGNDVSGACEALHNFRNLGVVLLENDILLEELVVGHGRRLFVQGEALDIEGEGLLEPGISHNGLGGRPIGPIDLIVAAAQVAIGVELTVADEGPRDKRALIVEDTMDGHHVALQVPLDSLCPRWPQIGPGHGGSNSSSTPPHAL